MQYQTEVEKRIVVKAYDITDPYDVRYEVVVRATMTVAYGEKSFKIVEGSNHEIYEFTDDKLNEVFSKAVSEATKPLERRKAELDFLELWATKNNVPIEFRILKREPEEDC